MQASRRFFDRRLWIACLAAVSFAACKSSDAPTAAPVVSAFTATPASITSGGSSTLAWTVSGATTLSIAPGVGTVTGSSVVVNPTTTTVYTLTASGAGGNTTAAATVTVTPFPVPVIASFAATPSTIALGASSTLAWSVTGATTLSIDNGIGTVTGTSVVVTPTATTTYTMTATNAAGSVTHSATVTIPAASLLLAGASTGTGMLGVLTDLPLSLSGTASSFHDFAGQPWIDDSHVIDAQALVWNGTDNKFYGVLNGGGAWNTGVLVSFDPATDALVLLKTLSGRTYPAKRGLGSDMLAFNKVAGFFRTPLLTQDGKGLLLLSSAGGVSTEGLLVHVNIDPTSASYLADTVVYDFFDYEVGQGNYCKSIRVAYLSGQTEMAWGKDGSGNNVVFMARVGEDYVVSPNNAPNQPGNCSPYTPRPDENHDRIYGRMFALRPTDAADLSKPWAFALGYDDPVHPGYGDLNPLLHMGRQIYWDAYQFGGAVPAVRWTTENVEDTELDLYKGSDFALFRGSDNGCFRLNGLMPLDVGGNSIATCSGINGATPPDVDSPPLIFNYDRAGRFRLEANLGAWYADRKMFRGATSSLVSRRLFANGGDDDFCLDSVDGCIPSTIEEMEPALLYAGQVLASGSETTTGQAFFGDPGVGGSVREPIADRYVVWFGTQRLGYSTTLNKYDRITGITTTLTFDPVEGAYPKGKLLGLGNGTALGFIQNTTPTTGQGKYGYGGGFGLEGSGPGFYVLDLGTGAMRDWIRYAPTRTIRLENFAQEPIRLDDGTVWTALGYGNTGFSPTAFFRTIQKVNLSTGAFTELYSTEENWNYAPPDPYTPAGRKSAAIYLPFWQSSVAITPTENQLVNATLGCVRTDDGTVNAQSLIFGPASAASGNANRIVYGATYSPTNDAMYLATSKVANADQGTIFEIDKGIADASLCRAAPVVTALVTGLTDVPSTKPLATRGGALFYGTANGRLMRINVAEKTVTVVADLKPAGSTASKVKGYLSEAADGVVVAVVFDHDASGKNTARRLVSVDVGTGAKVSRDVTALIDEWEPYPGVVKHN